MPQITIFDDDASINVEQLDLMIVIAALEDALDDLKKDDKYSVTIAELLNALSTLEKYKKEFKTKKVDLPNQFIIQSRSEKRCQP